MVTLKSYFLPSVSGITCLDELTVLQTQFLIPDFSGPPATPHLIHFKK